MTTTQNALELLASMEYPGRFMILGQDDTDAPQKSIVIYGVTGRSPPSRARVLIQHTDGSIWTKPTDEEQLKKGNPSLLVYSAIKTLLRGDTQEPTLLVSNGAQTELIHDIADRLQRATGFLETLPSPLQILVEAFKKPKYVQPTKPEENPIDITSFEPDPNYTPRISGVLQEKRGAFAIAKQCNGRLTRQFFEFSLDNNKGFFLATYTGRNVPTGVTLPAFEGEPIPVSLQLGNDARTIANQIYDVIGPKQGEGIVSPGLDMRVGVATLLYDHKTGVTDVSIKNRQETKQ